MIPSRTKIFGTIATVSTTLLIAIASLSTANPARADKTGGSGTFSFTASMNVARARHSSTMLNTGEVLVAGGVDVNGNPLISAELFSPLQGSWSFTGSLPAPAQVLFGFGERSIGSLLANGDVLASGDAFYTPATGSWAATGIFPINNVGTTAMMLETGKVLHTGFRNFCAKYCGGSSSSSAVLYDFSSDSYAFTGSMNTSRYGDSAVLLPNGQVLISGGIDKNSTGIQCLASAELYTP